MRAERRLAAAVVRQQREGAAGFSALPHSLGSGLGDSVHRIPYRCVERQLRPERILRRATAQFERR